LDSEHLDSKYLDSKQSDSDQLNSDQLDSECNLRAALNAVPWVSPRASAP